MKFAESGAPFVCLINRQIEVGWREGASNSKKTGDPQCHARAFFIVCAQVGSSGSAIWVQGVDYSDAYIGVALLGHVTVGSSI